MLKKETPHVNKERVLNEFNSVFLKIAGYSDKDLLRLGELSKLTSSQMYRLLNQKTMDALAVFLKRRRLKVQRIRGD